MALSEHFPNASQGVECVNGCLMPCSTTRVLCVFHHSSMPQGSAPSPGPDLHHLPKWEARGLAVLRDKFPRKTTLTSPPHKFSFGSPAQQSHTTHLSPQCCPGWPQTPPGDPMNQGDPQLLWDIFSPHMLFMEISSLPQGPASSSELKPTKCAQQYPTLLHFQLLFCILFAEKARKAPWMLLP